jgi:23S rRNA (uridine2552-2'-O)-methyltransferase
MSGGRRRRRTGNWARRQAGDPYVRKARAGGLRARAYFKLEQIDARYRLIRPSTRLVDLGSTPGSWTQYAAGRVADPEQVVAVDLLPMEPVSGVRFIQGDFTGEDVVEQVLGALEGRALDLVLSDMAPNITGVRVTDEARAGLIQEAVLDFCRMALRRGGVLLTKMFEGEVAVTMRKRMRGDFDQVQAIKPDASRSESRELYLLGRGFRGVTEDNGNCP